jgi:hypothetical protein
LVTAFLAVAVEAVVTIDQWARCTVTLAAGVVLSAGVSIIARQGVGGGDATVRIGTGVIGTGVVVVANSVVGRVLAPSVFVAGVCRTGKAVVTIKRLPFTGVVNALVVAGAGIAIVAGGLVSLTVTVVVYAVADFSGRGCCVTVA